MRFIIFFAISHESYFYGRSKNDKGTESEMDSALTDQSKVKVKQTSALGLGLLPKQPVPEVMKLIFSLQCAHKPIISNKGLVIVQK